MLIGKIHSELNRFALERFKRNIHQGIDVNFFENPARKIELQCHERDRFCSSDQGRPNTSSKKAYTRSLSLYVIFYSCNTQLLKTPSVAIYAQDC